MKSQKGRTVQQVERQFKIKSISLSVLCGILLSAMFLLLFSFLFSIRDLPLGLFQPAAVTTLLAGCLTSGFVCAKMMNRQGMMWGGICGGILFLCLLLSNTLCAGHIVGWPVVFKCIMMVTSGMIGGIFGVNYKR